VIRKQWQRQSTELVNTGYDRPPVSFLTWLPDGAPVRPHHIKIQPRDIKNTCNYRRRFTKLSYQLGALLDGRPTVGRGHDKSERIFLRRTEIYLPAQRV